MTFWVRPYSISASKSHFVDLRSCIRKKVKGAPAHRAVWQLGKATESLGQSLARAGQAATSASPTVDLRAFFSGPARYKMHDEGKRSGQH